MLQQQARPLQQQTEQLQRHQQQQPKKNNQTQRQEQPHVLASQRPEGCGAMQRDRSVACANTFGTGSGDGVLKNIDEDFKRMRTDKEKLQRTDLRLVLRRRGAHGTRGRQVVLEVNFLHLQIDKLVATAYQYDVSIVPETPKKFFRPVFAQFCAESYQAHPFAYDGQKIAYSTEAFPDATGKLMYLPPEGGRAREYTVRVKQSTAVDLSSLRSYMTSNVSEMARPMSAIQCLDVVLRCAYEMNPKFVRVNRCVYAAPQQRIDLGRGYELWTGLFQSALLGSRPYLNVDISHKAFPSGGSVLKVIDSFETSKAAASFLKGMDVVYRDPGGISHRLRCNGFGDTANKQRFKLYDGTQLTVADYFRQRWNYTLEQPDLPVLHVGSSIRSVYVPAELCEIPHGQTLNKKQPDECKKKMIMKTATNTAERKRKIMHQKSLVDHNNCPIIQGFGIGVGNVFEKVPARIIVPPFIEYANEQLVEPAEGCWSGKSFLQPSTSISGKPLRLRILNLDTKTYESTIRTFGKALYEGAKRKNVQMEPYSEEMFVLVRDCRRDLGTILNGIKKDNPTITIVVLPSNDDAYSKVKQMAELASKGIGLLTQCIKANTVKKKGTDLSTINNIMLKINAKTNGTNHCMAQKTFPPLGKGGVMYIGADVSHPLNDNEPSVVGVVASCDLSGFRYTPSMRLQGARDEMIRDLENIVHRQIMLYSDYNGALPERIMYFRDGVSDGQFAGILTIELQALHAAIGRIKPGYKPAVTFVVVQKRHHTRFFPTDRCPKEGNCNNVPPGTIVDGEITAPDRYEFYLMSHATGQGVAKPSKYVVLYDDSNWHPDELQALTYNLCHMFVRCNRSVSYPAPTYNAHLAAARGAVYKKGLDIKMDNLEAANRAIQKADELTNNHPMFFV